MNKSFITAAAVAVATSMLSTSSQAAPAGYENVGGYWLGGVLNLSPFASLAWEHDDNPQTARKYTIDQLAEHPDEKNKIEESDGIDIKAGLNLLLPGNHWKLDGRAFYQWQNYTSDYVDDRNDWAESLSLSGATDAGTTWAIHEMAQQIQYDDEFDVTQNDRKQYSFGGNAETKLTDKSSLMIGAFYNLNDYDDITCYDYSSYGGNLGFAHVLTEKTDWTLNATYTIDDKDEYDSKASGIKALAGIRTRSTEKLSFSMGAGAEFYKDFEYMSDDGTHYEDAETESSFAYQIAANWKISKRLTLRINGNSDYDPAEDVRDNSSFANVIGTALTYRPGDRWTLNGGIAFRNEKFTRKVEEKLDADKNPYVSYKDRGDDRTDKELSAFARVSFALNKNLGLYADWRYSDVNSTIDGYDYDRQRYSVGVSLKY